MGENTLAVAIVAGVVAVVALWGFWLNWQFGPPARRRNERDLELFEQIIPLLDELWAPLRFLADLRMVWSSLDETQRREIEDSIPYKDKTHEKRARACVDKLEPLVRKISGPRHRGIRKDLLAYLRDWEHAEPDRLKVFTGILRKARNEAEYEQTVSHQS